MKIKIITDSSADLAEEFIKENDISVLRMKITFGNEEYVEGVTITKDEFYEKLQSYKEFPKTSQINENEFLEEYKKCIDKYDKIIVLPISSALSGTYENAVKAAQNLKSKNIHIIDSLGVSFTLGAVIIETIKLIKQSLTFDKLLQKIDYLIKHIRVLAVADTIKYMRAGGRLKAASAIIGTILNIKPVITVNKIGEAVSCHKALGIKRAYIYIVENAKIRNFDYPVYFIYTTPIEVLDNFIKEYKDELKLEGNEQTGQVGSIVGAHVGPSCIGVIYFANNLI